MDVTAKLVLIWMSMGIIFWWGVENTLIRLSCSPNKTNIDKHLNVIRGFLGSLIGALLSYGALPIAFLVFLFAAVAPLVTISYPFGLSRRRKFKKQGYKSYSSQRRTLQSDWYFYSPICCYLLIQRLIPVSLLLQRIEPYIPHWYESLLDPGALILFLLLDLLIMAIKPMHRQRTMLVYLKELLLYLCLGMQLGILLIPSLEAQISDVGDEIVAAYLFDEGVYVSSRPERVINYTLFAAIYILLFELFLAQVPAKWYANCISLLNMTCGLVGVYLTLYKHDSYPSLSLVTLTCVILGQFFDLFDGRAAERWGSTKNGEIFDDIADGVSFGVCMGILVYRVMWKILTSSNMDIENHHLAHAITFLPVGMATLYACCVLWRLVRFVYDKRKENIKGGVFFFSGLPSPGTAATTGLLCTIFEGEYFMECFKDTQDSRGPFALLLIFSSILLIICLLTISTVPYPHLGRVLYRPGVLPESIKLVNSLAFVASVVHGIRHRSMQAFLYWFGSGMGLYLLTPLYAARCGLYERNDTVQEFYDNAISARRKRGLS
ncbi:CDP-diacylglycerol--serine O-phosphatidyltransferase [Giardia muris]|uniref:CDP-diacylglycerol--serine O-phosphatidyltransferase n=1 Tax=Giardia muris TaxID=5742 RepID=A0A4Z1SYD4_GIAMU|nr:CDP-diacylglycerol--serine O-phosphatidyltransferase [Giardia muris]|eukprot:TNJ30500.1 CDP-diacylglycerol--serine O-phosphatidyltransferase [Giardia muris]